MVESLSLTQISERYGIPKTTAHRKLSRAGFNTAQNIPASQINRALTILGIPDEPIVNQPPVNQESISLTHSQNSVNHPQVLNENEATVSDFDEVFKLLEDFVEKKSQENLNWVDNKIHEIEQKHSARERQILEAMQDHSRKQNEFIQQHVKTYQPGQATIPENHGTWLEQNKWRFVRKNIFAVLTTTILCLFGFWFIAEKFHDIFYSDVDSTNYLQ